MNNCLKYQLLSREYVNDALKPIPKYSVLFPKRGAAILNNKVRIAATEFFIDSNMMALEVLGDRLNSEFLYYTLTNEKLYKIADTSTIPQINNKHINPYLLLFPPFPEQQKIAQIFSTWDKAIEKLEALIAAKQKRKKALMQQLLTGKKRFAGFEGEWVIKSIGQILKETKRPVEWDDDAEYKLLSVKRRSEGVVLRERLKGSEILTKKMNITKSGDFLISKMQVIHGASGLVPPEFSDYHVSDSYIVLAPKNEKSIDIKFFSWFSKQKLMYNKALLCSYGVHIEKMTFNFGLYLKEKICIPPTIEEQQKIASVLSAADKEIEHHQKQLSTLKQQKKGLMQQLLTGKKRVKIGEAA